MTVRTFGFVLAIASAVAIAAPFGASAEPARPSDQTQPDRGAGASGKGDGSGMGQDATESGTPKGPGDKGGPPPDKTVAPKICDDGRQPVDGACPS